MRWTEGLTAVTLQVLCGEEVEKHRDDSEKSFNFAGLISYFPVILRIIICLAIYLFLLLISGFMVVLRIEPGILDTKA